jgi:OOP family OmpA-OmpF porin
VHRSTQAGAASARPRCPAARPAVLIAATALACLVLSARDAGARPARVTLAPGGGIAELPGALGVEKRRAAIGGMAGFTLSPRLAIELRAGTTSARSDTAGVADLEVVHGEANLTWFWTRESVLAPYLTAGGGGVGIRGKTAAAANVGGGVLIRFAERFGLRIDARDVMFQVPAWNDDTFRHMPELFAGLSFGLGTFARDSDFDGVPDKRDGCMDTPRGARVDLAGCPIDGDAEGVYDGLDECAGTPPGAAVDARGCPSDTDGDTVYDGIDQSPDTPLGARVDPRAWTPGGFPTTPTATGCSTASTSAKGPRQAARWTRWAARSTPTRTASATASTCAPTRRGPRAWMRAAVPSW